MTRLGRRKVREKAALARKHQPAFSRFFRKQGLLVLDRLETVRHQFVHKVKPIPSSLNDTWQNTWGNISQETFEELQEIVTRAEQDAIAPGFESGASQFDTALTFRIDNPRAARWFRQHGGSVDYIKGIQETTADRIKTVIAGGIDDGKSYTEIAKDIRAEFKGMTEDRALNIATYETGNAYEAGNRMFIDEIQEGGVRMRKAWNCEGDSCDICQANAAEGYIPVEQSHQSGHQQPQAHLHCICFETYKSEESAE